MSAYAIGDPWHVTDWMPRWCSIDHPGSVFDGLDYSGEWYLPICGGDYRLYVLERGQGLPLLAVHGGPGHDHTYLRDALGPLEDHHRVVYFDQRGSLRSSVPLPLVSFDAIIDDLARLVEELGEGPLPVIAHSMGAVIAAAALSHYPQLFTKLLLVNPGALRSDLQGTPPRPSRPEVAQDLARLGLDGGPRTAKDATWIWRIRFAGINLYHVERWRKMAGGMAFYRAEVGDAVRASMPLAYDYVPALQAHREPVTIVVGDHDCVDPGGAKALTLASGAVRTVVVPKAGHNLWIDQPERFTEIVQRALVSG